MNISNYSVKQLWYFGVRVSSYLKNNFFDTFIIKYNIKYNILIFNPHILNRITNAWKMENHALWYVINIRKYYGIGITFFGKVPYYW